MREGEDVSRYDFVNKPMHARTRYMYSCDGWNIKLEWKKLQNMDRVIPSHKG